MRIEATKVMKQLRVKGQTVAEIAERLGLKGASSLAQLRQLLRDSRGVKMELRRGHRGRPAVLYSKP
jgi:predicted ArsR family transcriptional regulator